MARGKPAPVGTTNVSANGYHYTKTEDGWRLTHHIIAEEKLGRPLTGEEKPKFVDGDRTNLDPSNIVVKRSRKSKRARIEAIKRKIEELKLELEELESS